VKFLQIYIGLYNSIFCQKFIELDILMDNLSQETPPYVITEGSEPQYFTRFFTWDNAKSAVSTGIKCYNGFDIMPASHDKIIVSALQIVSDAGQLI
jgi:hypothetical protein